MSKTTTRGEAAAPVKNCLSTPGLVTGSENHIKQSQALLQAGPSYQTDQESLLSPDKVGTEVKDVSLPAKDSVPSFLSL